MPKLLLEGLVFTGYGSRTPGLYCERTVKDGWEVRWTATNELSIFLLDAQGQPLEALGHSMGDAGAMEIF